MNTNKALVNPWKWQDQLGYAQAIEISPSTHTLYCAGRALWMLTELKALTFPELMVEIEATAVK